TITDSGLFTNLISESFGYELTYTIDDYLALLSTFSVYIALETQQRHALFTALKTALDREWGKSFQISCLATLHIANKII
ncbi:MAG: class I SAM-dependent methyltransferase, partial [Trichormus sp.]